MTLLSPIHALATITPLNDKVKTHNTFLDKQMTGRSVLCLL
jgi:hypothetical protein